MKPIQILVVRDPKGSNLDLLAELLRAQGYEVEEAICASEDRMLADAINALIKSYGDGDPS